MNNIQKYLIYAVVIMIAALLFYFIGYYKGRNSFEVSEPITIVKYDTIRIDKPVPIKVEPVKKKKSSYSNAKESRYINTHSEAISVSEVKLDTLDEVLEGKTEIEKQDTIRTYQDSTYKAVVLGELLSIETYNKTVTNTIHIRDKEKRWSIGIQAGFGVQYGIIHKTVDIGPYIGVGIQYRF